MKATSCAVRPLRSSSWRPATPRASTPYSTCAAFSRRSIRRSYSVSSSTKSLRARSSTWLLSRSMTTSAPIVTARCCCCGVRRRGSGICTVSRRRASPSPVMASRCRSSSRSEYVSRAWRATSSTVDNAASVARAFSRSWGSTLPPVGALPNICATERALRSAVTAWRTASISASSSSPRTVPLASRRSICAWGRVVAGARPGSKGCTVPMRCCAVATSASPSALPARPATSPRVPPPPAQADSRAAPTSTGHSRQPGPARPTPPRPGPRLRTDRMLPPKRLVLEARAPCRHVAGGPDPPVDFGEATGAAQPPTGAQWATRPGRRPAPLGRRATPWPRPSS